MSENFNVKRSFKNSSRFNKFISSLEGPENSDTPARISGLKRPRVDSPDFSASKRFCSGFNKPFEFQSPGGKNIANTRLQKIKDKLKNELLMEAANPVPIGPKKVISKELVHGHDVKFTNEPSCSRTKVETMQANDRNNSNNSESPSNQTFLKPNTPTNIYQNLDKWATPPESSNKNFANDRLQRLKKHILTPDKSLSTTNNKCDIINNNDSITSPNHHRSPLLIGIKRSLSDDVNNDCSSSKKVAVYTENVDVISQTFSHVKPPSLNVSKNVLVKTNKNCDNQLEIDQSNLDTPKKVNVLQNVKLANEKISTDCAAASVQEVNAQSSTKTKNIEDTSDHNANSSLSNFKPPPIVSSKPSKSSSFTDSSLSEPSDSFSARMERTALWVKNSLNNTNYEVEEPLNINQSSTINKSKRETSGNFEDTEEMEWTNAEPDEEIVQKDNSSKTSEKSQDNKTAEIKPPKPITLCIVVDTNIFISSLSKLKDILTMNMPGSSELFLYIPWMVMEELDFMKDRCSDSRLKKNIMKSIKFINEALIKEQRKVLGQTVEEAGQQKHIGTSQDDKIISCCMQVAEKYENVILLSNDMNLRNKALINDIAVCPPHEIIMKIMSKFIISIKAKKILQKMSILCSSIICECAKETYGDVWSKMDMLSCPPWSLLECLRRFKKYWNSIFKDKLMKQFPKTLEDLTRLLKENLCVSDDSDEYIKFVKLCIKLCIFLKDIEDCRGSVENTLRDLSKIG